MGKENLNRDMAGAIMSQIGWTWLNDGGLENCPCSVHVVVRGQAGIACALGRKRVEMFYLLSHMILFL